LRRLIAALKRLFAGHERIFGFLHSLQLQEQTAVVLIPAGEIIVVLSPHMDDEVLGCGGTLARHADAGARIVVVFLTNGRYGAGTSADAQTVLVAARQTEAARAGALLGITEQHRIDGLGNRLETDTAAATQLRAILESVQPAVVYLPSMLERHPDHRATTDLLARAVANTSLDFECRAYEVWTPLTPNRAVSIDASIERKRAAIDCYASQLEHTDFAHIVLSLNAYRSSLVADASCRYAEAFLSLPLARYLALHRDFRKAVAP
jgi:LmbE family N-acetylglucosaminyl deacetylase